AERALGDEINRRNKAEAATIHVRALQLAQMRVLQELGFKPGFHPGVGPTQEDVEQALRDLGYNFPSGNLPSNILGSNPLNNGGNVATGSIPIENAVNVQVVLDGEVISESMLRHMGQALLGRQRMEGSVG
ncbi:hypothetical protein LCGC14_2177460, partial [marine sediment metagenome]